MFGRAAGGVALDDEEFADRRVSLLAVGKLPGEAEIGERALASGQVSRLPGRLARL